MPYQDLCRGRVSLPHQVYHVTICTYQRLAWFDDFDTARLVIREMRRLQDERRLDSLAWVLMPDHLHWMFQVQAGSNLSVLIKTLKGRVASSTRRRDNRQVPLWQRGFHDRAVRHDEDLTSLARYIVANPLRAGLVERISEYPHWDAVWL